MEPGTQAQAGSSFPRGPLQAAATFPQQLEAQVPRTALGRHKRCEEGGSQAAVAQACTE